MVILALKWLKNDVKVSSKALVSRTDFNMSFYWVGYRKFCLCLEICWHNLQYYTHRVYSRFHQASQGAVIVNFKKVYHNSYRLSTRTRRQRRKNRTKKNVREKHTNVNFSATYKQIRQILASGRISMEMWIHQIKKISTALLL